MPSISSHLSGYWSDTTALPADCASIASSAPSSPASRLSHSIQSSESSGVSNLHASFTSPDTATYYGKERLPPRQGQQVLQGHQGSVCGLKRKRCLESDVAMRVLPSVVDFAHRHEEDRAYRLHRWLWDLHMPSKLQADHRGREGSPLPHFRCRQEMHRQASCSGQEDSQEPAHHRRDHRGCYSDPGGSPPRPGLPRAR